MQSFRDFLTKFSDEQRLERLSQCLEIEHALMECQRISELKRNAIASADANANTKTSSSGRWGINIRSTRRGDKHKQHSSSINPQDLEPALTLQDSRAGMKISRFYGWGLSNPRAQEAIDVMRANSSLSGSLATISDAMTGNESERDSSTRTRTRSGDMINQSDDFDVTRTRTRTSSPPSSCSRETHALWGCRAMAVRCGPSLVSLKKCFEDKLGTTNPQHLTYEQHDDDDDDTGSSSSTLDDKCQQSMRELGRCVQNGTRELQQRTG